jgi:hypothetical protein
MSPPGLRDPERFHDEGESAWFTDEPVTYVSRQLGHKDSAITLRVYPRWLPDETRRRGVDRLDETQPSATPAQPAQQFAVGQNPVSRWQ